ncbi:TspO/MBR family [Seminavis robusta]|uniref:TspO/MBR family n=1 Tax=Seminavis robusta TaxID=568900 RepID=A0A9N8DRE2_9STRA|nr:TspO/MBR family [Seminavis robusta]|eukprot:Sro298_g111110.1 TspO/MBR family (201) ;mRNA; f:40595-41197
MRKVGAILLLVLALQLALSSAIPTPFASFVSKKKARSAPRQQISKGTKQETPKAVNSAKGATTRPPVDFKAIGKYVGSLAVQMSALFLVWSCIDTVVTAVPNGEGLPRWTNTILFYALNLLSSKFNPLPKVSEGSYASPGRKRPSWTPPGWVFAVMWPFFVFGTRAYTMALIVEKVGYYANPITMSLMLHLGFATLWNSM